MDHFSLIGSSISWCHWQPSNSDPAPPPHSYASDRTFWKLVASTVKVMDFVVKLQIDFSLEPDTYLDFWNFILDQSVLGGRIRFIVLFGSFLHLWSMDSSVINSVLNQAFASF